MKPTTEPEKLKGWEENDAQALSTILMNITPNAQARLDCTSSKSVWDGLVARYAQAELIAQNLAHTRLLSKRYTDRGSEMVPAHLAELQKLRETCRGLGLHIPDAQLAGTIMLSMPSPSWDPVMGTLGGILDPKVIISCLSTEWSRRQGLTLTGNDANVVFQTGFKTSLQCENCNWTGHTKAICRAKDGGQEGQYPDWFKGKEKVNTNTGVNKVADTHIVWAYGSETQTDIWYADSTATVHVCTNQNNFSTYQEYQDKHTIRTFGKDEVYGIGEGDIDAEVEFQGKITRIKLTNVMHVPGRTSNILSLKILDQRGFESQMAGGRLCILKKDTILTKTPPGREQYEVNLKIHKPEVLATVQKAGHISDLEPCQHLRTNDGPDTSPIDENKWLPAVAMLIDDGTYASTFCTPGGSTHTQHLQIWDNNYEDSHEIDMPRTDLLGFHLQHTDTDGDTAIISSDTKILSQPPEQQYLKCKHLSWFGLRRSDEDWTYS